MKKNKLTIVWAALCLKKTKAERPKLKAFMFLCLAILAMVAPAWAQEPKAINITPVKIGEQVPNELWDMPMQFYKNGKYVTETLKQHKGKVIVFDFWATWCGNCIEGFPKLRKLQDSLGDGLQIILVNQKGVKDTNAAIENIFRINQLHIGDIPTTIQDTLLAKFFIARSLPSYAIISGDRFLQGIALGTMFHAEDVKKMVADRAQLLEFRRKYRATKGGQ